MRETTHIRAVAIGGGSRARSALQITTPVGMVLVAAAVSRAAAAVTVRQAKRAFMPPRVLGSEEVGHESAGAMLAVLVARQLALSDSCASSTRRAKHRAVVLAGGGSVVGAVS